MGREKDALQRGAKEGSGKEGGDGSSVRVQGGCGGAVPLCSTQQHPHLALYMYCTLPYTHAMPHPLTPVQQVVLVKDEVSYLAVGGALQVGEPGGLAVGS